MVRQGAVSYNAPSTKEVLSPPLAEERFGAVSGDVVADYKISP